MKKTFILIMILILIVLILVSCTSDIVKSGGVVIRAKLEELADKAEQDEDAVLAKLKELAAKIEQDEDAVRTKLEESADTAEQYIDEDIVYTTKSGTKYHKQDCIYLSSSKIPISLLQAIDEGKQPCSRCYPDI